MLYRRLADFVVLMHCLTAVYLFIGGFLAWSYPWTVLIHIPFALWVSTAFVMGWTCPLTPLENWLRRAAGTRGYEGSFVDHYLARFVLPETDAQPSALGRRNEIILGLVFCVLTILPHTAKLGQYRDAIWQRNQTNLNGPR